MHIANFNWKVLQHEADCNLVKYFLHFPSLETSEIKVKKPLLCRKAVNVAKLLMYQDTKENLLSFPYWVSAFIFYGFLNLKKLEHTG